MFRPRGLDCLRSAKLKPAMVVMEAQAGMEVLEYSLIAKIDEAEADEKIPHQPRLAKVYLHA